MNSNAKDAVAKIFTGIHRTVFDATKGRIFGQAGGMPVVKLTTTGRKSGKRRETMLTTPLPDREAVVLVASWGGDDRQPTWLLNLRDDPEVHLTLEGRSFDAKARVLAGGERREVWSELTSAQPRYQGYQDKTDREIPVVICDPTG